MLTALCVLALGGCAAPAERLRVNLVSVRPVDVRVFEQRFEVALRVQNPNDTQYAVRGIDVVLEVNDRELGSAVSDQSIELPAYGETLVEMTMTSGLLQLLRQVDALTRRGDDTLSYRLRGHLRVAGGLGTLRFDNEGELDLRQLDRGRALRGAALAPAYPRHLWP